MIIGVPRRLKMLVPDSLKIGRKVPGPGTADEQVASEIEIKCGESRILLAIHGLRKAEILRVSSV
jgi:hypothetical protein